MATTAVGRRLTRAHQTGQTQLTARVVGEVDALWPLFEQAGPDVWIQAVMRVLSSEHRVAQQLARTYYDAYRASETALGPFGRRLVAGLNEQAVATSLMVTGPIRYEKALERGVAGWRAASTARASAARAASRIVLDGGRDVLRGMVNQDRRALGEARVASSGACAFCAMLASQGPVYKSRNTARFEAHDGCGCSSEPVFFRDQPWPPGSREAQQIYKDATKGESDLINSFRRAWEGRDT